MRSERQEAHKSELSLGNSATSISKLKKKFFLRSGTRLGARDPKLDPQYLPPIKESAFCSLGMKLLGYHSFFV